MLLISRVNCGGDGLLQVPPDVTGGCSWVGFDGWLQVPSDVTVFLGCRRNFGGDRR
ncbi:hypothetical protein HanHA300_Chr13g0503251 [Helianthus annuus]|nr:hypothetical protein HanHA300_Chr13g0503251 [Helianthus annuus]KAJ0499616.1 hypothetical protein HanHA89_Chr13g0535971 [Helianthus annuus]KAJ0665629.1 hypothetical protein HanLR1_Chr13g0505961 [Helianthus annuus]